MYEIMSNLIAFIFILFFQNGAYALDYCTMSKNIQHGETNKLSMLQDFIGRRMHAYRGLYLSPAGDFNPTPIKINCLIAEHAAKARTRDVGCKEGWDYTNYNFKTDQGYGSRCCLSTKYEKMGMNNCARDFVKNVFYGNDHFGLFGGFSKILTSDSDYYKLDWTNIEMAVDNLVRHPKFHKYMVESQNNEWGAAVVKLKNSRYTLSYVNNDYTSPWNVKCLPFTAPGIIPTVKPTLPPPNAPGGVSMLGQEIQYPETQDKTFLSSKNSKVSEPFIDGDFMPMIEDFGVEVIESDENEVIESDEKLMNNNDIDAIIRKFTGSENIE